MKSCFSHRPRSHENSNPKTSKEAKRPSLRIFRSADFTPLDDQDSLQDALSTEATVDDGKACPKVVQQVRGRPKLVIGDGAYDDRDVRDLIREKRMLIVLQEVQVAAKAIDLSQRSCWKGSEQFL